MNIPILFFKMSTLKPSYHRTSKACSQLNQPDSYHKTPRSLEFFGNSTNIQGQMFIQCLSVKCNSLTECQTFVGYIFLPFPLIFIVTCCCCQFLFHHHHPIHQLPRHLLFSILFFFFKPHRILVPILEGYLLAPIPCKAISECKVKRKISNTDSVFIKVFDISFFRSF